MGTKENPGKFDYHDKALPDEPTFTLLARDPDFAELVQLWATKRMARIRCGDAPTQDTVKVDEALSCASDGAMWRRHNYGKWRK
jgi:hypothetical protein